MRGVLCAVILLGIFLQEGDCVSCRTCRNEECGENAPELQCSRNFAKLPFGFEGSTVNDVNADFVCVVLTYLSVYDGEVTQVEQCYVATEEEELCSEITDALPETTLLVDCQIQTAKSSIFNERNILRDGIISKFDESEIDEDIDYTADNTTTTENSTTSSTESSTSSTSSSTSTTESSTSSSTSSSTESSTSSSTDSSTSSSTDSSTSSSTDSSTSSSTESSTSTSTESSTSSSTEDSTSSSTESSSPSTTTESSSKSMAAPLVTIIAAIFFKMFL